MNIRIGQLNHLAAELNSFYGQNHPVMLNVAVTEPFIREELHSSVR